MSTLSEKLESKAKEFKTNLDAALAAEKIQVEQKLSEAKAKATRSKEALDEKVTAGRGKFEEKLSGIKEKVQNKKAELSANIEAKKTEIDRDIAEWDAQDAEEYAAATLDVALAYIDEAETAALQAIYARLKAESLKA